MNYEVHLRPAAERDLRSLPQALQHRILAQLAALADDPRPRNSQELRASLAGLRRLRVGAYRVSYVIDEKARLVRVGRIGHRSTFYRRLKP